MNIENSTVTSIDPCTIIFLLSFLVVFFIRSGDKNKSKDFSRVFFFGRVCKPFKGGVGRRIILEVNQMVGSFWVLKSESEFVYLQFYCLRNNNSEGPVTLFLNSDFDFPTSLSPRINHSKLSNLLEPIRSSSPFWTFRECSGLIPIDLRVSI